MSASLIFFTIHAVEDVYYVKEGVDLVSLAYTTEKMQPEAVQIIHETCDRFWRFCNGIKSAYESQQLKTTAVH